MSAKGFLVILLLPMLCSLAFGQAPRTPEAPAAQAPPFQQGNALYQGGQYQQAQQQYLQQLKHGPVTVPLLYNLGNACYQSQQLGWAILYYERALLAAPRDADLRANFNLAMASRRVPQSTEAPGWTQVLWRGILDHLTLNELTLLLALSYLAACALAFLWLRHGELRRRYQWLLYLSLALTLLFGTLTASKCLTYHDPHRAVIVADGQLLSGPATSFQSLRKTYQGEIVRVTGQQGMWREAQFDTGAVGWVPQSDVETILPSDKP